MAWNFGQEEFLLTYQNQLDVIQELKGKSWKAANYSVLGQAAIFAINKSSSYPISDL